MKGIISTPKCIFLDLALPTRYAHGFYGKDISKFSGKKPNLIFEFFLVSCPVFTGKNCFMIFAS